MQCQSPMSHSKFNGSRNVLTLLSVKMTERDMRQWSHRGPPRHYYHSIGSPEKLTACITNCGWMAGSLSSHGVPRCHASHRRFITSLQHHFINESMDIHSALMNSGFSVKLPCGAAHFESFDKSTQSRYSALALSYSSPFSYGALHFSSPLSAWTLLICPVMAKQYFCMGNKQSGVFSLSFWRGALHHTHIALQRAPFYQCLLYLYLILPLCSSLCSPQKYTHIQD